MELFCPEYYSRFACKGGECKHSCCVGWEIEVDSDTLGKYEALGGKLGEEILSGLDSSFDGSVHFRLGSDGRCPHLRGDGLCRIICEAGEGYLCDICREHPRFYNAFRTASGVRYEVGVGASCEAAAELILTSADYKSLITVNGNTHFLSETRCGGEVDILAERARIYNWLSHDDTLTQDKLAIICDTYGASPDKLGEESVRELLSGLEYLDERHKELFSVYRSGSFVTGTYDKYVERFFAYLVYRHLPTSEDARDLSVTVAFCALLAKLYASLIERVSSFSECVDMARIISEEIEYNTDNIEEIKFEIGMFGII